MNKDELINLLKSNSFWAKKSFGQNFLVDDDALDKIIGAAELQASLSPTPPNLPSGRGGTSEELVIEVGPGMGALTERLVNSGSDVIAVEMDDELAEYLKNKFKIYNLEFKKNDEFKNLKFENSKQVVIPDSPADGGTETIGIDSGSRATGRNDNQKKLTIINDNILKTNIPALVNERKYKVVANIPYYITSKIIRLFLEQENKPELMVLLVQKEVAERICAKPGDMSVLAISVQYYGKPEIVSIVPANSFFPAPKVDSAILKVSSIKYQVSSPEEEHEFFRLVNMGFASKRKTLVNNLSAGLRIDKKQAADIIISIGLGENVRAQELSLQDWKNLVKSLRI